MYWQIHHSLYPAPPDASVVFQSVMTYLLSLLPHHLYMDVPEAEATDGQTADLSTTANRAAASLHADHELHEAICKV